MPLTFTGLLVPDGGRSYHFVDAHDAQGLSVIVRASDEAMRYHDRSTIERVAAQKFIRGDVEHEGSVLMLGADCPGRR